MKKQYDYFHAVNNTAWLTQFLESNVRIAEGDVCLVKHDLVMRHDTSQQWDLYFADWFLSILDNQRMKRGIKMDIKSGSSLLIQEVKKIGLKSYLQKDRFVIANMDIFQGPGGDSPDYTFEDLLEWRMTFPELRLSAGCTQDIGHAPYPRELLAKIANAANKFGGPIDINLRAIRVSQDLKSIQQFIKELLSQLSGMTVTIWRYKLDPQPDHIDVEIYRSLAPNILLDL